RPGPTGCSATSRTIASRSSSSRESEPEGHTDPTRQRGSGGCPPTDASGRSRPPDAQGLTRHHGQPLSAIRANPLPEILERLAKAAPRKPQQHRIDLRPETL